MNTFFIACIDFRNYFVFFVRPFVRRPLWAVKLCFISTRGKIRWTGGTKWILGTVLTTCFRERCRIRIVFSFWALNLVCLWCTIVPLTVTLRASSPSTLRAGSLQPRGSIFRKWYLMGSIWYAEVIPHTIEPTSTNKNSNFRLSFPVETTFQFVLPVSTDTTKNCEIEF